MTIEIWSINHKDRSISLCLCGMMPLRNHFCKKSVPSGQHPPINSLHVRPWLLHGSIINFSLNACCIAMHCQCSVSILLLDNERAPKNEKNVPMQMAQIWQSLY